MKPKNMGMTPPWFKFANKVPSLVDKNELVHRQGKQDQTTNARRRRGGGVMQGRREGFVRAY